MTRQDWVISIAGASFGALVMFGIHVLGDHVSPKPAVARLTPPSAYKPSPENDAKLNEAVNAVLAFVLLHETGHLLISEYDLPVLGREEDAADRFAVAAMTINGASKNYDALLPVAAFWDEVHLLQSHFDWSDAHGEPEQRALDIFCLVYGEDPQHHDRIAEQIGLSESRRQRCKWEAEQNIRSWATLLGPLFKSNPEDNAGQEPSVAVVYDEVPASLPRQVRAALDGDRSTTIRLSALEDIADQLKVLRSDKRTNGASFSPAGRHSGVQHPDPAADLAAYDYVLRGNSCLDAKGNPVPNAFWNAKSRSLTLCYGLIDEIREIEMALIASAQLHMKR